MNMRSNSKAPSPDFGDGVFFYGTVNFRGLKYSFTRPFLSTHGGSLQQQETLLLQLPIQAN